MFIRLASATTLVVGLALALLSAAQPQSSSEAERLTAQAASLVAHATTAETGIETLRQALALWRRAGDRDGEARVLFLIGRGFNRLSRQEDAIAHYEQALSIRRDLKNRVEAGRTLAQIGISYSALSRYDQAIARLDEALALARETKMHGDEAVALSGLGSAYNLLNRYEKAIEHLEPAIIAARETGDASAEASALNNLGTARRGLRLYDQAAKDYQQALGMYRAQKDRSSEAGTLSNLAIVHNLLNRNEEAITFYRQALDIHRELKNRTGEGIVLNNLGQTYIRLRQYDKAIEHLEPALVIAREVKRRTGEANTLTGLADARSALGYPERAIADYEQALVIHREVKSRGSEASTLLSLSDLQNRVGRYEGSIQALGQALAIAREMKDAATQSNVLSTLADAYHYLGRSEEAIDHYQEALVLARSVKDRSGEGIILNSLGQLHNVLERNEQALEYLQQGIAIARELKRPTSQTHALNSLGEVYGRMGQHDAALAAYSQALDIARDAKYQPGEGLAMTRLGDTNRRLGLLHKAEALLQPALTIARGLQDPEAETMTLTALARLARDRGDLTQARAHAEATLERVEAVRSKMYGRESRAAYFASAHAASELLVDILTRMHTKAPSAGYDALALDASERRRARGLLELLTEAGMDVRQGVDPKLLERERAVERQLNRLADTRVQMRSRSQTPEAVAAMEQEITGLEQERERIQIEIRRSSPKYAALAHPDPLTTRAIQSDLLDADTVLVEFLLGDERSHVWALTKTSLVARELPKRRDIDSAVRTVLDLLTARRTNVSANNLRDAAARSPADPLAEAAHRLSQMVLGPVAKELRGRRLVIVADGALQYLPFAMLPAANGRPLIVDHEIVMLPSASTLAMLRKDPRKAYAGNAIAVIADPVFSPDDQRLKSAPAEPSRQPAAPAPENTRLLTHLTGVVGDSGASRVFIPRLPFTRTEAERILDIRPDTANFKAVDFAASKETVTSGRLATHRYVHFATHGYFDTERPAFSSIVLSTVDENGRRRDGFLRASDIYNLRLAAEVVVLSACQSGLGRQIKGEGVVGLTRSFMYAGAPRIVVSLWNVSDEATSVLMATFYEGMLRRRLRPAAALRAAQVEMLRDKRWSSPYYWAAFTLQGEWR